MLKGAVGAGGENNDPSYLDIFRLLFNDLVEGCSLLWMCEMGRGKSHVASDFARGYDHIYLGVIRNVSALRQQDVSVLDYPFIRRAFHLIPHLFAVQYTRMPIWAK